MKGAFRVTKNLGYSSTENKVRNATSNSNTPPSGQQMHELAVLSYDRTDFAEIMEVLDKRLNDKGKNWRHVYKSLCVIDYLLHTGSPAVAAYFRQNIYLVKTLRDFQHIDEEGKDAGSDVRVRARDVATLLMDDVKLREARSRRKAMRARMMGSGSADSTLDDEGRKSTGSADEGRKGHKRLTREETDLARAIKLSEEEEKERLRKVAEGGGSLFDNIETPLIDLSTEDSASRQPPPQVAMIQPQYTQAFIQPQYTQAMVQPQMTSIPTQFTAYDPYAQQAQYDAMVQAEHMRQQAEAQQQFLLAMQASQQQQQKPLAPQPTGFGSNNPFAQPDSLSTPGTPFQNTTTPSTPNYPFLSHTPEPSSFRSPYSSHHYTKSTPALTHRSATASSHASSVPPKTPDSSEYAHSQLERLFKSRIEGGDLEGGVDTFGNTGGLRYGGTAYGQLVAQKTGQGMMGQGTGYGAYVR